MILGCRLAGNRSNSYLPFLGLGREASGPGTGQGSHLSRSHWRRGSRPPSLPLNSRGEQAVSRPLLTRAQWGPLLPGGERLRPLADARGEQQQQAERAARFPAGQPFSPGGASLAASALSLLLALALISPGSFPRSSGTPGSGRSLAAEFCRSVLHQLWGCLW